MTRYTDSDDNDPEDGCRDIEVDEQISDELQDEIDRQLVRDMLEIRRKLKEKKDVNIN